jgi:hypothetical protein
MAKRIDGSGGFIATGRPRLIGHLRAVAKELLAGYRRAARLEI